MERRTGTKNSHLNQLILFYMLKIDVGTKTPAQDTSSVACLFLIQHMF